ncbi:hypothetical protein [Pontibacter flavimaris]|nr:hypothetical protein [Pontibacter flavimaris]
MAKKKEPKKRPEKYEQKLHVKGTFEDLLKVSVSDKKDKPKDTGKEEKK